MTIESNDKRIPLNPGDMISYKDYEVICEVPTNEKTEITTTLVFSHKYSNISTSYGSYAYAIAEHLGEDKALCRFVSRNGERVPGVVNESLSDDEVLIKAIEEMVKGSLKVKDVEGTPKYYIDSQVILNNMNVSQDKSVSIEKTE